MSGKNDIQTRRRKIMKHKLNAFLGLLAAGLLLYAAPALAQTLPYTLPGNTVVGRPNIGTGEATAMQFDQFASSLRASGLLAGVSVGGSVADGDFVFFDGSTGGTIKDGGAVLPNNRLANMPAATFKCNPTNATAAIQDCTIPGLIARGAPDANNDKILIYDSAAGMLKYVTPGQIASPATAGVSSFNGQTGAINLYGPPQGRLTLTSGTAIPISSVAGATTLYYTPAGGQFVPIYNGTQFVMTDIGGELSQATTDTTKSPSAVAPSQVYDIFVWNDSGTSRATRGPAWSAGTGGSNTVRGTGAGSTALTLLKGFLVNANAITNGPPANQGTYVGTVMSDAASALDMTFGGSSAGGTAAVLGVWNAYNRVHVTAKVNDNTASWTYSGGGQSVDASTNNRVSFVSGLQTDSIIADYYVTAITAATSGSFCFVGPALDSAATSNSRSGTQTTAAVAMDVWANAHKIYPPQVGSHFVQATEAADGTHPCTFLGGATPQALEFQMQM
ncbi:hypothetical protein [Bradyrhizobium sp. dw_411]|uniref:hypothetical protein n=1 Tax=Bradyrhizobium sp. dw_411 TaxID=2720082 RepID=UPI001BCE237C|nr:hypothetical protein [Bradyrhizobium sp. dw_411]